MALFAQVKHAGGGLLTSINCFIWVYDIAKEGVTNQSGEFSVIYATNETTGARPLMPYLGR